MGSHLISSLCITPTFALSEERGGDRKKEIKGRERQGFVIPILITSPIAESQNLKTVNSGIDFETKNTDFLYTVMANACLRKHCRRHLHACCSVGIRIFGIMLVCCKLDRASRRLFNNVLQITATTKTAQRQCCTA
jgi:hypothetical protein